ncbi:MAG: Gfo/Idh/MocA family oxidoreductase [Candidatus Poribacteria bacterium]|nr:Gfo/Idh/MocA family oxidoreductase [Candidatus Poribacteria bacterium]
MSDRIYKIGAIGRTGKGEYGHGLHLAYKGLNNVEFIAVADTDEAGREKAKTEIGAKHAYADYHDMLEKENLDIVSVCPRWVDCHLDMILACIEAGCHVYCEKPMASSLEDGDRMIESADRARLKIAVAHQGVYLPGIQTLKRMLYEGCIGKIQAIYAHGKQDSRGGGEDMIVLGTHLFNMMRFFVGDVDWMFAHVTSQGHDITSDDVREGTEPVGLIAGDCINSYFAFKNGVSGFFDSRKDQIGSDKRYGMDIVGSNGIISLRGGTASDVSLYPYPLWSASNTFQKWESLKFDDTSLATGNQLAIIDLIDAIENDRKPISSGSDAVSALEMILGAYESQLTSGRVTFPMKNRKHPLEQMLNSRQ